eukprot:m.139929 g.139929  ORF g.139929 m.139929 type:complete len:63 (-) comp14815_c0_seq8:530-718(-)
MSQFVFEYVSLPNPWTVVAIWVLRASKSVSTKQCHCLSHGNSPSRYEDALKFVNPLLSSREQ